jgi:hypothetical protein
MACSLVGAGAKRNSLYRRPSQSRRRQVPGRHRHFEVDLHVESLLEALLGWQASGSDFGKRASLPILDGRDQRRRCFDAEACWRPEGDIYPLPEWCGYALASSFVSNSPSEEAETDYGGPVGAPDL